MASPISPSPKSPKSQGLSSWAVEQLQDRLKDKGVSVELRSALSYARILDERGDRACAHELLSQTYASFTEGFETPDLQEAKSMLEALV